VTFGYKDEGISYHVVRSQSLSHRKALGGNGYLLDMVERYESLRNKT
jgi:hypothetical protein